MRGLTPWFLVVLMALAGCSQQQEAAPVAVVARLPKTPEEGTALVIQYINAGNYAGLAAIMDQTSQQVWKTDPNMFTSRWNDIAPKPIRQHQITATEPQPGGNVVWVTVDVDMPGAPIPTRWVYLKWMKEAGGWRLLSVR